MTANTAGDKVLYVRVPARNKEDFDDIAKRHKQSASKLVNRLIEYLIKSSVAQQQAIIGGRTAEEKAVDTISHLMMRQSWADHAFSHRRWTWACEEYMELARMSEDGAAPGTWRLAQYKLGYCWIEIGIELQSRAIEAAEDKNRIELFDAAEWAMRASIAFNRRYYKYKGQRAQSSEQHAVVEYNIACTWALLAKARIERELHGQGVGMKGARKKAEAGGETWPLWPLGQGWEERVAGRKWRGLVEETLGCLNKLAEENEGDEEITPPRDRAFLLEFANRDPDLRFIGGTAGYSEKLDAITRLGEWDILAAFERSRALVERYVRDDMPDVDEVLRRTAVSRRGGRRIRV